MSHIVNYPTHLIQVTVFSIPEANLSLVATFTPVVHFYHYLTHDCTFAKANKQSTRISLSSADTNWIYKTSDELLNKMTIIEPFILLSVYPKASFPSLLYSLIVH